MIKYTNTGLPSGLISGPIALVISLVLNTLSFNADSALALVFRAKALSTIMEAAPGLLHPFHPDLHDEAALTTSGAYYLHTSLTHHFTESGQAVICDLLGHRTSGRHLHSRLARLSGRGDLVFFLNRTGVQTIERDCYE